MRPTCAVCAQVCSLRRQSTFCRLYFGLPCNRQTLQNRSRSRPTPGLRQSLTSTRGSDISAPPTMRKQPPSPSVELFILDPPTIDLSPAAPYDSAATGPNLCPPRIWPPCLSQHKSPPSPRSQTLAFVDFQLGRHTTGPSVLYIADLSLGRLLVETHSVLCVFFHPYVFVRSHLC